MRSGLDGDVGAEERHRGGEVELRLQRLAGLHPGVVASVEQAYVLDAGVEEDQRGPGGGDLAGPATGPLLVGFTLGVAAVEDDGGVARDPECA